MRRLGPVLAIWLLTSAPSAQDVEGVVPLRTGFIPDPAVLYGTAAGDGPSGATGTDCELGFFGGAPSHVLLLETRVGFLRLYATGPGDLAIAVRDADGGWHCNDDRFGRHPAVEGTFSAGRVEVWIGTHASGERSEYQLRLTETRSMRPGVGDGGEAGDETALARDAGMEVDGTAGRFDGIRLRRGFLPDPRFLAGDAAVPENEEGIDANVLGGDCHGLVAHTPSHTIELLDDFDFFQVYLVPLDDTRWPGEEPPPISLLVLHPDGTFICDAGNADGIEISRARWTPGLYRVWIGVDAGEAALRYRLGLSEIRRVR